MLRGHEGSAFGVFSPDDRWFASGGKEGELRLWDLERKDRLKRITVSTTQARRVAFHPDGSPLACGTLNGEIAILDPLTREILDTFQADESLSAMAWSPDGRWIATGSWEGRVRVFEAEGWGQVAEHAFGGDARVACMQFESHSGRLALGFKNSLFLWSWSGDGSRREVLVGAEPSLIEFSNDGTRIAVACLDNAVHLLDASDGSPARVWRGTDAFAASGLSFTPDGCRLLTAGASPLFEREGLQLRDLRSGSVVWEATGPKANGRVEVSPHGERVLTASGDCSLTVWSSDGERIVSFPGRGNATGALALSPDGTLAVIGNAQGELLFWDARPWD